MRVEIGPGPERLSPDWTTVSAVPGTAVDFLAEWGLDRLPFDDCTVSEIYACHVIEHIGWMNVEAALVEAWRVLRVGGTIEIHTIDFAKAVEVYRSGVKADDRTEHVMEEINFRLFAYAKRPGDRACANWHHGAFDRGYLEWRLEMCGFGSFERVDEPRGPEKHGAYNLGVRGVKA